MPSQGSNKQKDPVQQRLRKHKRNWSTNVSEFVSKLFAVKNTINGRGDAKANLQPTSIKDPLPGEVGALLDQLASQFQSIIQDGGSIIDEQANYSRTRRKRRPKQLTPAAVPADMPQAAVEPTAPANDNVNPLARIGSLQIEKDATSRLSRMWEYMRAPFSGKDNNKYRVGMLSTTADLYYSILDFENDILSLSINSIPAAIKKYQMSRYSYDALKGTLDNLIGLTKPKDDGAQQQGQSNKAQNPARQRRPQSSKPMKDIKYEMHFLNNHGFGQNETLKLNEIVSASVAEQDPHKKSMLEDRAREAYANLIRSLSNEIQKKYGPSPSNSSEDLIALIEKNEANKKTEALLYNNDIIKNSHNIVSRFLKRQLIKARSYNKTAVHRLAIAEVIDDVKVLLKKIMNGLQSGLNQEELSKDMTNLEEYFKKMNEPLSVLGTMYKENYYSKKKKNNRTKQKQQTDMGEDEFMDYMLRRKVRRDLSRDIF
jgi:hypothetical protein